MKTVTLEVVQPSTGPVCPGQEAILTCTVSRESVGLILLIWRQDKALFSVLYDSISPQSEPQRLGDFNTTAAFINNSVIISNATLKFAALSNSNSTISCESPPQDNVQTAIIIVAGIFTSYTYNIHSVLIIGAEGMPFGLQITASASLAWLPPLNTNCTFNYTVNITNSSCSMTVYSSSTSLILTDLLTRRQNYSFAVAVTDSTGQHGPWSDQLMVIWDGKIIFMEL